MQVHVQGWWHAYAGSAVCRSFLKTKVNGASHPLAAKKMPCAIKILCRHMPLSLAEHLAQALGASN